MTQVFHRLTIDLPPMRLAVCRLEPGSDVPPWAQASTAFLSITQTPAETSIIIDQQFLPPDVPAERDWQPLKLHGPLAFHETGILASVLIPLAEASVPVLTVSTYTTDYILIRQTDLPAALTCLGQHHDLHDNNDSATP